MTPDAPSLPPMLLPCDACGGAFLLPGEEAARHLAAGHSLPRRCEGARQARKEGGVGRYEACPFGAATVAGPRGVAGAAPRPRPNLVGTGEWGRGVITRISRDRGFGSIAGEDGRSFFFHAREVAPPGLKALRVGQAVHFEEAAGDDRPRALGVAPCEDQAALRSSPASAS
ncbi:MAG: cold shock domain-containing protein [Candidatus Sericytochromatia bacterium]|nr:cold shock domain-containing protein [Candidatus Sericytochromatia bacterium]